VTLSGRLLDRWHRAEEHYRARVGHTLTISAIWKLFFIGQRLGRVMVNGRGNLLGQLRTESRLTPDPDLTE